MALTVVMQQKVNLFKETADFSAVVMGSEVSLACNFNLFHRKQKRFVALGQNRHHSSDYLAYSTEETIHCSE